MIWVIRCAATSLLIALATEKAEAVMGMFTCTIDRVEVANVEDPQPYKIGDKFILGVGTPFGSASFIDTNGISDKWACETAGPQFLCDSQYSTKKIVIDLEAMRITIPYRSTEAFRQASCVRTEP